ncbi:MAG: hypothetical protein J6Q99_00650, partial [Oscillospiraceae bacterium]|nr:hypothetical protein [Oscillospiraceae bacterium]
MLNKLVFWVERKIVSPYLSRKDVRFWGLPFYFAVAYSFVWFKRTAIPYGIYGTMFLVGTWCVGSL